MRNNIVRSSILRLRRLAAPLVLVYLYAHPAIVQTWTSQAGVIELTQVWLSFLGLRYGVRNLREVSLDFEDIFQARGQLLADFLWPRRWWPTRTDEQRIARANLMSEVIKSFLQCAALAFGIWSCFQEPPPPYHVVNIFADATQFGPALLGKELLIIIFSLGLMVHSRHERYVRIDLEGFPRPRRTTDTPLPQLGETA